MSDMVMWRNQSANPGGKWGWVYNHGRGNAGRSVWTVAGRDPSWGTLDGMTGVNQLTGDGSVRWKPISAFNSKLMKANPTDPAIPRTNETYY